MSPGSLSLANDYLGWILKNHPEYPTVPSRRFIAKRGVELVNVGIFTPSEIMENLIRRNIKKQRTMSDDDSSLPTHLDSPDGAAMDYFDRYLDESEKTEKYKNLFEQTYGTEEPLPTEFE